MRSSSSSAPSPGCCRHRLGYAGTAGPLAGYRPFRQHRQSLWRAASAICVDAISMRTRSRSTVRPLWPPPSPARFASLGATIDYAIMATTPVLWILYAGRIVAGITGATGAVAGAYIADITDGEDRARHFGLMSACFGVGMVAGPVAGDCWAPSPCMHHSLRRRCSTASTYYWAAS